MGDLRRWLAACMVVTAVACDGAPAAVPAVSPSGPEQFCERYHELKSLARTEMLTELIDVAPPGIARSVRRASVMESSMDEDLRINAYLDEHCG